MVKQNILTFVVDYSFQMVHMCILMNKCMKYKIPIRVDHGEQ